MDVSELLSLRLDAGAGLDDHLPGLLGGGSLGLLLGLHSGFICHLLGALDSL